MKAHYDVFLVGATAFAAGFVLGHPDLSCAVVESGCIAAPEFSAVLYSDNTAGTYVPATAAGRDLQMEAINRKALEASEWLPAVSPIMAEHLLKSGADCYFMAALTDIERVPEGLRVTFTSFGGTHTFTAAQIIDTTSLRLTHAFVGKDAPEAVTSLNYWVNANGSPAIRSVACDTIAEGRLKILENCTDEKEPLVDIASELVFVPKYTPADAASDLAWLPSVSFGNFLRAYDMGACYTPDSAPAEIVSPAVTDIGSYDVIVVGLGTAGSISAYTAAKQGLRVLGLENLAVMGGAGTVGGVTGYYYGFRGGIYTQIDEKVGKIDGFGIEKHAGGPQKSMLLDVYHRDAGVDNRYRAAFTGVTRDGSRITGVTFMQNGLPYRASAKFVIDCTAESTVCVAAGCEMVGGRPSDGDLQPYSSMRSLFRDGKLTHGYIDNGTINQYDPDDYGRETLLSSSCYIHLLDDYSDHSYLGICPLIGMREGRKIVGEENIAFRSMIDGVYPERPIYYGNSNLDNHGKDSVLEDRDYQDWITICGLWGWGLAIPVPMGALIPRGIDGLLVGGRNVAVDHDLAMGLRMKDDAQKSGESAAKIAALAIRHNIPAREVSYDELKPMLLESGCLKDGDRRLLERQRGIEFHEWPYWCFDEAELEAGISGDAPGYFIWSCRYSDHSEMLYRLLRTGSQNARWNAAFALALTDHDDAEVVTALIEAANSRDGYLPNTGRKYITLRSISAISALGRIHAAAAAEPLLAILRDNSFIEELPFEPYMFMIDRGDLYFQYESTAIGALCEIASANPALRDSIKAELTALTAEKTYEVSPMGTVGFKKDVTDSIRGLVAAI